MASLSLFSVKKKNYKRKTDDRKQHTTLLLLLQYCNLASRKRVIEFPELMGSELLSEIVSQVKQRPLSANKRYINKTTLMLFLKGLWGYET